MSLRVVTWKETMDEWYEDPHKLLAWFIKCLWDAKVDPDDSMITDTSRKGMIVFGLFQSKHRVPLRLCEECAEELQPLSHTVVTEKKCQCICHKAFTRAGEGNK